MKQFYLDPFRANGFYRYAVQFHDVHYSEGTEYRDYNHWKLYWNEEGFLRVGIQNAKPALAEVVLFETEEQIHQFVDALMADMNIKRYTILHYTDEPLQGKQKTGIVFGLDEKRPKTCLGLTFSKQVYMLPRARVGILYFVPRLLQRPSMIELDNAAKSNDHLLLDLTDTTEILSSASHEFAWLHACMNTEKRKLILVGVSDALMSQIRQHQVSHIFHFAKTLDEAVVANGWVFENPTC